MTRQQKFNRLVARLNFFNSHGTRESFEQAQRDLATFAWRHADKITVASDPPRKRC